MINPSCGGVSQRTPPPASLLQLLPSVWMEGLAQLGWAASGCRPQEPALHLAGAPWRSWRNIFCRALSGNLAGFPCFFWNLPLPLWGTLQRETGMDFTYVWFLAVSLMLTHQHQGNPISTLSCRHRVCFYREHHRLCRKTRTDGSPWRRSGLRRWLPARRDGWARRQLQTNGFQTALPPTLAEAHAVETCEGRVAVTGVQLQVNDSIQLAGGLAPPPGRPSREAWFNAQSRV